MAPLLIHVLHTITNKGGKIESNIIFTVCEFKRKRKYRQKHVWKNFCSQFVFPEKILFYTPRIRFTRVNIDLYKMTLQQVLAAAGSASVYGASLP